MENLYNIIIQVYITLFIISWNFFKKNIYGPVYFCVLKVFFKKKNFTSN